MSFYIIHNAAEEYFTSRSMVDVRELKETYPDSALVLDVDKNKTPTFSSVSYKKVPVTEIGVGSFVLVQAGEVRQQ